MSLCHRLSLGIIDEKRTIKEKDLEVVPILMQMFAECQNENAYSHLFGGENKNAVSHALSFACFE
jgi:hypothetical protein